MQAILNLLFYRNNSFAYLVSEIIFTHHSAANKIRNNLAKWNVSWCSKKEENGSGDCANGVHTKWEMSMSWRSLKQNILIEFGKRMTLWILLTQKKIESHYFWSRTYIESPLLVLLSTPFESQHNFWFANSYIAEKLILASFWNGSHRDNKTISFHLKTPQVKIDCPII